MSLLNSLRCVGLIVLHVGISLGLVDTASGIDPDILRVINSWREYEGIEVKGIAYIVRNGKKINEKSFVICRGTSSNQKVLRPKSVATLIPNPGEPHLKSDKVVDFFHAANNGVGVLFTRRFISIEKPGGRMSSIHTSPGNHVVPIDGDDGYLGYLDALVDPDFLSNSGSSDDAFGILKAVEENWEFSIAEEGEFLGIKGKVIEARYKLSEDASRTITLRTLVAFEPSVRVLKLLDAKSPSPEVIKTRNERNAAYRVKKFEVFSGLLIPTITELGTDVNYRRFEITEVNRLPANYHGLWEFDGPTGTKWGGDLMSRIRKSGVHQKPVVGAGLEIPFTEEEKEAIRTFLISKNSPVVRRGIEWTSVLFYASSLIVLICVSLVVYRNVRGTA